MPIRITADEFDPYQELAAYQTTCLPPGKFGATAVFIGTMRDFNENNAVQGMHLEHYPGMTEQQLALLVQQASSQWAILDSLIIHKVGDILPNQSIVLIAVWATQRGDACDACRYLIEALKTSAPFWKKEILDDQTSRWLMKNSDGYQKTSS